MLWALWGLFGLGCLVMGLIMLGRNDARGTAQRALESHDPQKIRQALLLHMPREVRQRLEQRLKELDHGAKTGT